MMGMNKNTVNIYEVVTVLSNLEKLINSHVVQEEYSNKFDAIYYSASAALKKDLVDAIYKMQETGLNKRASKSVLFAAMVGLMKTGVTPRL